MLPSPAPQTRGFLFADLRGYSAFVEAHGDLAARELLHRYRALVRAEIDAFHGAEVRTEGDSFYVVFDSVSEAVQAGLAIRDAAASAGEEPNAPPIRVGIGIHAGEVTDGEDGIVSSAVNIAARVCAVAGPGEVLVTDTVRALTRTFLSVSFSARGRPRLKGITEPVALFAVNAASAASRRPLRAALAIGVVVVLITTAAVLLDGGRATASDPGASARASGASSPGPSDTAETPRAGSATAYPNADEAALLDRMPSSIAASCERADTATVPVYLDPDTTGRTVRNADGTVTVVRNEGAPTVLPLAVRAGVNCLTGLTRVIFWHARMTGDTEEIFVQLAARRGIEVGSCATSGKAREGWDAGAHAGELMCYTEADGTAVLEWTYGSESIYAIARRRDGDKAALYAWWRDIGRLMSR